MGVAQAGMRVDVVVLNLAAGVLGVDMAVVDVMDVPVFMDFIVAVGMLVALAEIEPEAQAHENGG